MPELFILFSLSHSVNMTVRADIEFEVQASHGKIRLLFSCSSLYSPTEGIKQFIHKLHEYLVKSNLGLHCNLDGK